MIDLNLKTKMCWAFFLSSVTGKKESLLQKVRVQFTIPFYPVRLHFVAHEFIDPSKQCSWKMMEEAFQPYLYVSSQLEKKAEQKQTKQNVWY